MNSLEIKTPLLPDDGQVVVVKLKDDTVLLARYTAKSWQTSEDLQKSFEPVGVKTDDKCGLYGCKTQIIFNCDIVSWKAYK